MPYLAYTSGTISRQHQKPPTLTMKDPTAASLHELGNSISKALADIRGVQVEVSTRCSEDGVAQPDLKPGHFGIVLDKFIAALDAQNKPRDAEALRRAKDQVLLPKDQGGLALELWKPLTTVARDSIMFWVEAWLRSLSSAEHAQQLRAPLLAKPSNTTRRCMTLTEKILAHHVIDPVPVDGLRTGDVVRVVVDWVIASESSYFVRICLSFPPSSRLYRTKEKRSFLPSLLSRHITRGNRKKI